MEGETGDANRFLWGCPARRLVFETEVNMCIGVAELWVVLTIAAIHLVPIAAAVWALVTLHRIRAGQDAIRRTLESIEKLLQRAPIS
jgi:hypothetical protein